MSRRGFTLIELIVVLAVVALLTALAAPRYIGGVERARESTLRSNLKALRDAIDQFAADRGRYPETLAELQRERYLREVPLDPITDRRDSWLTLPGSLEAAGPNAAAAGVGDVRSGAAGRARDGSLYADW